MKYNHRMRVKRMVWARLEEIVAIKKRLTNTFFNLAKLMRDKALIEGFKTLQDFDASYLAVKHASRLRATHDAESILRQLHVKRVRRAFKTYHFAVCQKRQSQMAVTQTMKKVDNHNLRDAFRRWAMINRKDSLVVELNETGPITEHVFEARRTTCNLKAFMKSENFTDEEIKVFFQKCKQTNRQQMAKVVKRLKIPVQDRVVCRCFDHWAMWLKVRKLMRHYLRFCNLNVQEFRCDIRRAFDKWKRADRVRMQGLMSQPLAQIMAIQTRQANALNKLAEQEANGGLMLRHLSGQRDELITNFIRSQKLANALLRDNCRKSKGYALRRWHTYMIHCRKHEGEYVLHTLVSRMTKLKKRSEALRDENQELIGENKELTQFSIDGIQTALDLQEISLERDQLRERLQEHDADVLELMEEQQDLIRKLAETNAKIEELVRQRTLANVTAADEALSPMERANVARTHALEEARREPAERGRRIDIKPGAALR